MTKHMRTDMVIRYTCPEVGHTHERGPDGNRLRCNFTSLSIIDMNEHIKGKVLLTSEKLKSSLNP
jgi:hypothetical protein